MSNQLFKLAKLFEFRSIKLGQGDPFAERSEEDSELLRQVNEIITGDPNTSSSEASNPEAAAAFLKKYKEDQNKKKELKRVKDEFREKMESLGKPEPYSTDDWSNHYTFEERKLMEKLEQLKIWDPKFYDAINAVDSELNAIGEKEVQDFYAKEKAEQQAKADAIKGKSVFVVQDAANIVNSEVNAIRAALKSLKPTGKNKVTVSFNGNNEVNISSDDVRIANALRRSLYMPLVMDLRSYLTVHKKYFETSPIAWTFTI